jgi:sugar phosphate permease
MLRTRRFTSGGGRQQSRRAASGWLSWTAAGRLGGRVVAGAVGIGLTFPTLMAAATAHAPHGDTGTIGGLANTATQIGGSIGLAPLATAAGARTATRAGGSSPAAALAAGYNLVFLSAAGLSLAIALVSVLLPSHRHN